MPFHDRLIICVPYENRLRSFRKDIHQLWSTIFNNANVLQKKLIVDTTIRRNIKLELVRTCPHSSQITLPKQNRRWHIYLSNVKFSSSHKESTI